MKNLCYQYEFKDDQIIYVRLIQLCIWVSLIGQNLINEIIYINNRVKHINTWKDYTKLISPTDGDGNLRKLLNLISFTDDDGLLYTWTYDISLIYMFVWYMTIFNRKSDKKGGSADSGYDEDGKSRQSLESRQSLPTGPVISTTRTFQGKFYDPGHNTAHMYGYLISIAFFFQTNGDS